MGFCGFIRFYALPVNSLADGEKLGVLRNKLVSFCAYCTTVRQEWPKTFTFTAQEHHLNTLLTMNHIFLNQF